MNIQKEEEEGLWWRSLNTRVCFFWYPYFILYIFCHVLLSIEKKKRMTGWGFTGVTMDYCLISWADKLCKKYKQNHSFSHPLEKQSPQKKVQQIKHSECTHLRVHLNWFNCNTAFRLSGTGTRNAVFYTNKLVSDFMINMLKSRWAVSKLQSYSSDKQNKRVLGTRNVVLHAIKLIFGFLALKSKTSSVKTTILLNLKTE